MAGSYAEWSVWTTTRSAAASSSARQLTLDGDGRRVRDLAHADVRVVPANQGPSALQPTDQDRGGRLPQVAQVALVGQPEHQDA